MAKCLLLFNVVHLLRYFGDLFNKQHATGDDSASSVNINVMQLTKTIGLAYYT